MTVTDVDLATQLEHQLANFSELSLGDIELRMQWIWNRLIGCAKDVERFEKELLAHENEYGPGWQMAFETSEITSTRARNVTFHTAVADRMVPEYSSVKRGLESQRRVALRWASTLKDIHEGLRTHSANVRQLGGHS